MDGAKKHIIKEKYLGILNCSSDLSHLCDFTAECIGIPVAITLTTRTIIAKSSNYTEDLLDEYVNGFALQNDEEIEQIIKEVDGRLLSRKAFSGCYPCLRHKLIMCGCFYKGINQAALICPITKKLAEEEALEIIQLSAPVFTTALRLNGFITEHTRFNMQNYLLGLLNNDIQEKLQQKYLCNSPLEKLEQYCLAVGTLRSDEENKMFSLISNFCERHMNMWCERFEKNIVILTDAKQTQNFTELCARCGDSCQFFISEPYTKLTLTHDYYYEITRVMKIAAFEGNHDNPIFAKKYRAIVSFLSFFAYNKSERCVDPLIDEIKTYDKEHNTEYYLTLKMYLLNERNYQFMADKLHIHKSTVTYRMQRIVELFDLNFKDNRTISSLYLSLLKDI